MRFTLMAMGMVAAMATGTLAHINGLLGHSNGLLDGYTADQQNKQYIAHPASRKTVHTHSFTTTTMNGAKKAEAHPQGIPPSYRVVTEEYALAHGAKAFPGATYVVVVPSEKDDGEEADEEEPDEEEKDEDENEPDEEEKDEDENEPDEEEKDEEEKDEVEFDADDLVTRRRR